MVNGKALEIIRELAKYEPGRMRVGDTNYCAGFCDGQVSLARQILKLLETAPDPSEIFRRRHYILWSDELFPTISNFVPENSGKMASLVV